MDAHQDVGRAGVAAPPVVAVGPQFELQGAALTRTRNVLVGVGVDEPAINIIADAEVWVAVEAVLAGCGRVKR